MRKMLIGSAIVFLMIFTAGLTTAWQPASLFPFTASTGTLYFISRTGTVTSDNTTAKITLNEATVTTGEPTNFFWGTLELTPVTGTTLTFDIAATRDEQGVFHITGSTSGATLSAEGTIEWPHGRHGRHGRQFYKSGDTSDNAPSITLGGSIQDGTTFSGRFQGVLSE